MQPEHSVSIKGMTKRGEVVPIRVIVESPESAHAMLEMTLRADFGDIISKTLISKRDCESLYYTLGEWLSANAIEETKTCIHCGYEGDSNTSPRVESGSCEICDRQK